MATSTASITNTQKQLEESDLAETPPNIPAINLEAACGKLSISCDSFECITQSGEKVAIAKAIIEKIPYLKAYFRSELDGENQAYALKPAAKNDDGLFILPAELDASYIKPILSYVESGEPLDLLAKLSTNRDVHQLLTLFDFLLIEKPKADDLDSIRERTTGDIIDYNDKIARHVFEHHSARYGRLNAREAAGEFCVGLALGSYDLSIPRTRQKVYSRMLFILSHPRTFRRRLRRHAKAISDEVLAPRITVKQKGILDDWVNNLISNLSSDEESDTDRDLSDSPDEYDSDFD